MSAYARARVLALAVASCSTNDALASLAPTLRTFAGPLRCPDHRHPEQLDPALEAAAAGNTLALAWLRDQGWPTARKDVDPTPLLCAAARHASLDQLKQVHMLTCPQQPPEPAPTPPVKGRWGAAKRSSTDTTAASTQAVASAQSPASAPALSHGVPSPEVVAAAACSPTMDAFSKVAWLLSLGCRGGPEATVAAARAGHLRVLQLLQDRGCYAYTDDALGAALQGGHTGVAHWLTCGSGLAVRGEPGVGVALAGVVKGGHDVSLSWLLRHNPRPASALSRESLGQLLCEAVRGARMELLPWLLAEYRDAGEGAGRRGRVPGAPGGPRAAPPAGAAAVGAPAAGGGGADGLDGGAPLDPQFVREFRKSYWQELVEEHGWMGSMDTVKLHPAALALAVRSGSVETLQLVSKALRYPSPTQAAAPLAAGVFRLPHLTAWGPEDVSLLLLAAVSASDLPMLQHLLTADAPYRCAWDPDYVPVSAAAAGAPSSRALEVMQWLEASGYPLARDARVLTSACRTGDARRVAWLMELGPRRDMSPPEVSNVLSGSRSWAAVLEAAGGPKAGAEGWAAAGGTPSIGRGSAWASSAWVSEDALPAAAQGGCVQVLDLVRTRGTSPAINKYAESAAYSMAARYGDLLVLEHLQASGWRWEKDTVARSIPSLPSHPPAPLAAVRWMLDAGAPHDGQVLGRLAVGRGAPEVAQWLHERETAAGRPGLDRWLQAQGRGMGLRRGGVLGLLQRCACGVVYVLQACCFVCIIATGTCCGTCNVDDDD